MKYKIEVILEDVVDQVEAGYIASKIMKHWDGIDYVKVSESGDNKFCEDCLNRYSYRCNSCRFSDQLKSNYDPIKK